jgi:hypothetical protein
VPAAQDASTGRSVVVLLTELERGGDVAAMENPAILIGNMRELFRRFR